MIVRVAARVDVSDTGKLLVGTQLQTQEILFDPACKITCAILRNVRARRRGIDKRCSHCAGLDNRHSLSARAARAIGRTTIRNICLHDAEGRQYPVGIDLVDVIGAQ